MSAINPSPVPSGERRVLLVDDDRPFLRAAARILESADLAVVTADSAEAALALLEESSFDVVVSDYRLPGWNGIQLLSRLRHRWPETVCILVSGQADLATVALAVNRVGVFRFLLKPVGTEELVGAVRRACDEYELTQQRRLLTMAVDSFNKELAALNRGLDLEVSRRTEAALSGLLNALDLRDTEGKGHSRRVALLSGRLARALELPEADAVEIERGALLHDIGKIGVSDTILRKRATLTVRELEEVRRHTVYGFEILRGLGFLGRARELVRSHHERFDGGGYPDRLAGEAIYIGARVFGVIDAYDAMTTDRPYRAAMPAARARVELASGRGSQFDPRCLDVFLALPEEELQAIRDQVDSEEAG